MPSKTTISVSTAAAPLCANGAGGDAAHRTAARATPLSKLIHIPAPRVPQQFCSAARFTDHAANSVNQSTKEIIMKSNTNAACKPTRIRQQGAAQQSPTPAASTSDFLNQNQILGKLSTEANTPSTPAIPETGGLAFNLALVTAYNDAVLPFELIEYYAVVGDKIIETTLKTDQFGVCRVAYPANAHVLKLTVRPSGFGGTYVSWQPQYCGAVPANYIWRIYRPLANGRISVSADHDEWVGPAIHHQSNPFDPKAGRIVDNYWIEPSEVPEPDPSMAFLTRGNRDRIPGCPSGAYYVSAPMTDYERRHSVPGRTFRSGTLVYKLVRSKSPPLIVPTGNK